MAFMGKIKYKKYPKAIWIFMTKEQQMQVCKLIEQQGIKPAKKQTNPDARIAVLRQSLGLILNPRRMMSRKRRERLPRNHHGGEMEGIQW